MIEVKKEGLTEWQEMDFSSLKECLFEIGFTFKGAFIDKDKQNYEYGLKYHGGLIWVKISPFINFDKDDWLAILYTYPTGKKKDQPSSERFTGKKWMTVIFEAPDLWTFNSIEWESPLKLRIEK